LWYTSTDKKIHTSFAETGSSCGKNKMGGWPSDETVERVRVVFLRSPQK